jgi:hypothetical protein
MEKTAPKKSWHPGRTPKKQTHRTSKQLRSHFGSSRSIGRSHFGSSRPIWVCLGQTDNILRMCLVRAAPARNEHILLSILLGGILRTGMKLEPSAHFSGGHECGDGDVAAGRCQGMTRSHATKCAPTRVRPASGPRRDVLCVGAECECGPECIGVGDSEERQDPLPCRRSHLATSRRSVPWHVSATTSAAMAASNADKIWQDQKKQKTTTTPKVTSYIHRSRTPPYLILL